MRILKGLDFVLRGKKIKRSFVKRKEANETIGMDMNCDKISNRKFF